MAALQTSGGLAEIFAALTFTGNDHSGILRLIASHFHDVLLQRHALFF
jgi:hypothetical protein